MGGGGKRKTSTGGRRLGDDDPSTEGRDNFRRHARPRKRRLRVRGRGHSMARLIGVSDRQDLVPPALLREPASHRECPGQYRLGGRPRGSSNVVVATGGVTSV